MCLNIHAMYMLVLLLCLPTVAQMDTRFIIITKSAAVMAIIVVTCADVATGTPTDWSVYLPLDRPST